MKKRYTIFIILGLISYKQWLIINSLDKVKLNYSIYILLSSTSTDLIGLLWAI